MHLSLSHRGTGHYHLQATWLIHEASKRNTLMEDKADPIEPTYM